MQTKLIKASYLTALAFTLSLLLFEVDNPENMFYLYCFHVLLTIAYAALAYHPKYAHPLSHSMLLLYFVPLLYGPSFNMAFLSFMVAVVAGVGLRAFDVVRFYGVRLWVLRALLLFAVGIGVRYMYALDLSYTVTFLVFCFFSSILLLRTSRITETYGDAQVVRRSIFNSSLAQVAAILIMGFSDLSKRLLSLIDSIFDALINTWFIAAHQGFNAYLNDLFAKSLEDPNISRSVNIILDITFLFKPMIDEAKGAQEAQELIDKLLIDAYDQRLPILEWFTYASIVIGILIAALVIILKVNKKLKKELDMSLFRIEREFIVEKQGFSLKSAIQSLRREKRPTDSLLLLRYLYRKYLKSLKDQDIVITPTDATSDIAQKAGVGQCVLGNVDVRKTYIDSRYGNQGVDEEALVALERELS